MAGESTLTQHGLRPRHLIALTILRDRGETGQADLAETLQIDRTNLVGLLNELEDERLIARSRRPEDRRRHTVALTDAGARRLAKVEFALAAVEDELLKGLDERDRQTLHDLLLRAAGGCRPAAPGDC